MLIRRTIRGPSTSAFQIAVRTVFPSHATSRGPPTFNETSFMTPSVCRGRPLLPQLVGESAGGLEETVVIGAAAGAHLEVERGARELLAGIAAAQLDLDVLVHDWAARLAAGVALVG